MQDNKITYKQFKIFVIGLSLFFFISLSTFLFFKRETIVSDLESCNLNSKVASFRDFKGDFSLINEDGLTVSNHSLLAAPALLYFGYTFCPDICPFDLMRNSQTVDLLHLEGIKVKPIFISLDHKRDSPKVLKDFTSFHHPNMIGLTGSEEQLKRVTKIYKVYSELPKNTSNDYIVNHSTFTYFILPEEGIQTYFTRQNTPTEMAEAVKCIIKAKDGTS